MIIKIYAELTRPQISSNSLSWTSNQTSFTLPVSQSFLFSGSEHQPVDGGAGPAHVQGPTVCPGHGEPDESGGRKVEGGLGKPPQPQSKGVSGNWPSVVTNSGGNSPSPKSKPEPPKSAFTLVRPLHQFHSRLLIVRCASCSFDARARMRTHTHFYLFVTQSQPSSSAALFVSVFHRL